MRASVLFLLLLAGPLRAVQFEVRFGALERLLGQQVFTEEGRKYVRGNSKTRCTFAYLEHPRIRGQQGRLRIQARFTGRSALNMFGQCVGLGDAFDVVILATPEYRDGNLGLAAVTVTSAGKTGFYIRRVCAALAASLGHEFRYPLAAQAQKLLEDPGPQPYYRRQLRHFTVASIGVTDDALVLAVDFDLTVQ